MNVTLLDIMDMKEIGMPQPENLETNQKMLVIFDLDNTLRDNKNTAHLIPSNIGLSMEVAAHWAPWQQYVVYNSPVIPYMARFYKMMLDSNLYEVWIVTSSSFGTSEWLSLCGLPQPHSIIERNILVNSHSREYKEDFLSENKRKIHLWVDDCPKTCELVRGMGIKVLQVTHNDYEHQKDND